MSKFEKHYKCPCGKSSDALAIYTEGTEETYHCFSCDDENIPKSFHKLVKKENMPVEQAVEKILNEEIEEKTEPKKDKWHFGVYADIKDRKIKKDTVKKYRVRLYKEQDNTVTHMYPYYDVKGKLVGYKQRKYPKEFVSIGRVKDGSLFGMSLFPKGGKYITITEGELDALAAYQLMGGAGPVISLRSGAAGVKRDFQRHEIYEYLNSFNEIVVCFDNDEEGRKAAETASSLFDYKKVKIMKLDSRFKDACDYLIAEKYKEFQKAFWNAEYYQPSNIVDMSSEAFIEKAFFSKESEEICYPYPFKELNETTSGARFGEQVTIWADTGIGKSHFLKELEYHFRKTTGLPIGLIHFEDTKDIHTAKYLTALELQTPIYQDKYKDRYTKKQQAEAFKKINKELFLYSEFGSKNIEEILDAIQYMVKARDCKFIFFDHINMVTADQRYEDERKALDEVATKLKTKTVEWNFNLHIIAHSNRMDQIRGTSNIEKLSNIVLKLQRDVEAEDEIERNTTKVICVKNRYSGVTGFCGQLFYNKETGRFEDWATSEFEVEG